MSLKFCTVLKVLLESYAIFDFVYTFILLISTFPTITTNVNGEYLIRNRNKGELWEMCRNNRIVNPHLFRDYVRILSSIREKGWVCGCGKSGNLIRPIFRRHETRRNDRQSRRRIRSREQKWVHRFEYRNCIEKKATVAVWRRKRKEKDICGRTGRI